MEFSMYELIWAIINFLIFFGVIRLVFWKPIIKMLEDRRQAVIENIARAEEAKAEAERLRQEYEQQLQAAREESKEIINKAVKMADETRGRLLNDARGEADRIMERAQRSIREEKDKALAELREEVASLAVLAAERVIEKEINEADHKHFVRQVIDEVGEVQ